MSPNLLMFVEGMAIADHGFVVPVFVAFVGPNGRSRLSTCDMDDNCGIFSPQWACSTIHNEPRWFCSTHPCEKEYKEPLPSLNLKFQKHAALLQTEKEQQKSVQ